MHLYQNYQQKSAFFSKLQGFEPNKREKPREEEHFYQNLQHFKRRKMKNQMKKTKKNNKTQKKNNGLGF